ncbi:MAG: DNA translocase FtsK [Candidatus Aminicenantales bacterium]
MSKKKKKPVRSSSSRNKKKRHLPFSEIIGILLVFLGLYMLISLLSYDSRDPSLSPVTSASKVHNYGGRVGAWLAGGLLQIFGLTSILLPVLFLYFGFRAILSWKKKQMLLKLGWFSMALLLFCPFLSVLYPDFSWRGAAFATGGGGRLGTIIYKSILFRYLNHVGALIFLLAALLLFLILSTGLSFKKIFLFFSRFLSFTLKEVRIKITGLRQIPPTENRQEPPVIKTPPPESRIKKLKGKEIPKAGIEIKKRGKKVLQPDSVKGLPEELLPPERLLFPDLGKRGDYHFPPFNLLDPGQPAEKIDKNELYEKKQRIEEKLREFRVEGEVKEYHPGPVITTYEFYPDPGIKVSQVAGLAEDLSLALGAESVRIQRIPGKSSLGVEIPNNKREIIKLRDILQSDKFMNSPSKLTVALGKTIHGEVFVTDLSIMPHLLIAGATGTGKSVCLHSLIASILYKATPEEVKLILIDPKRLEFTLYDGIPHLLSPVINDPKKAGAVLMDAIKKMEDRYFLLSSHKVRNIEQYNHLVFQSLKEHKGKVREEEKEELKPLPYLIIIIDELAELMMVGAQDVEYAIARLAQLARAVGIHLVMATQRPSIDVITGTIKNNFSSRIAFRVPSKVDSRIIIDTGGADKLLGLGDMLFMPPNYPRLVRLHCAYVSIPEIRRLIKFVREQGTPHYDERIVHVIKGSGKHPWEEFGEKDELYEKAMELILLTGQASASYLQRKLKLGYARASRIIDQMEQEGILGPSEGSKPREILVDVKSYLDKMIRGG